MFRMHVHLVFVAKYRRKVFTKDVLDYMRDIFAHVCQKLQYRYFSGA
ncbi:MAG: transposase [Actinomycetaceae bacterium]|nr:transposase [Actinomycetaceae bacterium]